MSKNQKQTSAEMQQQDIWVLKQLVLKELVLILGFLPYDQKTLLTKNKDMLFKLTNDVMHNS